MKLAAIAGSLVAALIVAAPGEDIALVEPAFTFPRIAESGGVVAVPGGVDAPRPQARIVFDVSAESPADGRHRGLEAIARYINLHASAGHPPSGLQVVAVLHGGATKAVLEDSSYAKHVGPERNPNLDLIGDLRAEGVDVLVCGQSLARNRYPMESVTEDVALAVSAMSVLVNRQQDGFAVISIH